MSYIYRNEAIYFHSALKGHKLDNISSNPKVSFSVVGEIQLLAEQFTTNYESVVACGTASEIWGGDEKIDALLGIIKKIQSRVSGGWKRIYQKRPQHHSSDKNKSQSHER